MLIGNSERLLRVMTAAGYVEEPDETTYASNALTAALAARPMGGLVEAMYVDAVSETLNVLNIRVASMAA
jgi:hypothetical protein